jgi:hypothetical protein
MTQLVTITITGPLWAYLVGAMGITLMLIGFLVAVAKAQQL